jgi:hypothetical protein
LLQAAARRADAIRAALDGREGPIAYCVPWHNAVAVIPSSADAIFSQAVLQSVADLDAAYSAMKAFLKPGGLMSHCIDFGSLSMAPTWDGHRAYGERWWTIIKGRRPHCLNRLTLSAHLALLAQNGFETLHVHRVRDRPSLPRKALAERFRHLDDDDLETRVAVIVARKPEAGMRAPMGA